LQPLLIRLGDASGGCFYQRHGGLDLLEPRPHLGGQRRAFCFAHLLELIKCLIDSGLDAFDQVRGKIAAG